MRWPIADCRLLISNCKPPIANRRFPCAFTLVEVLVVIGIIVLLAGLFLPMVIRARQQAARIRVAADLQTVAVALEAYKQDFGDYPRVDTASSNTGFAVLGKSLLGPFGTQSPPVYSSSQDYSPGDCVTDSPRQYVALKSSRGVATSDTKAWAEFDPRDGADGTGFRLRQGKVWGPYLASGKLKNQGVALLDHHGNPILYFPARPTRPNITQLATGGNPQPYVDRSPQSLYNANDNFEFFRRSLPDESGDDAVVLRRIRIMLGDLNSNGCIDGSETPVTPPFLLWSAGADGVFGPANYQPAASPDVSANRRAVEKCDDVMNTP